MHLKGTFYTSWCKKQQEEQSEWYPAILRLSKTRVQMNVLLGDRQKDIASKTSHCCYFFYSDLLFSSEDQIRNNHQDKFKLPWKKYYIPPRDFQNAGFIVDA